MNTSIRILFAVLFLLSSIGNAQNDEKKLIRDIRFCEKKVRDNRAFVYDSIMFYANKQLELAKKLQDSLEIGRAYLSLGIASNNSGKRPADIKYLFKARELFSLENNEVLFAQATLEMASLYKEARTYISPIDMLYSVETVFKAHNSKHLLARTYLELGLNYRNLYNEVQLNDSILYYYNKSKKIAESISDYPIFYATQNDIADYYLLNPQKNLDTVIQLSNQVIEAEKADIKNKTIAHLNKALALREKGNKDYLQNLEIGFDLAEFVIPKRVKNSAASLLYEHYQNEKDFEKALFYYKNSIQERNSNVIGYKNFLFEDLEKEALITKQQNELISNNLYKQRSYIYALIIGFIILLIFSLIVYQKNKTIQLKNADIKKKKENIESLIKEIHHRVKNNLQMIVGLLDLHQSSIKNKSVSLALNDASSRVKSIALIHQNLYSGNTDMVTVGFKKYIEELIDNLLYSYDMLNKIKVNLSIDELKIPFDRAVTLGLLVTELTTNALKHAFKDRHNNTLDINLTYTKEQLISLIVKDNGLGLPPDFSKDQDTFGIDLIKSLVNDLNGEIDFKNNEGTEVKVQLCIDINYQIRN